MAQTRREFLKTAAAVSAASVAGLAVPLTKALMSKEEE